jgi:hypothetical protein
MLSDADGHGGGEAVKDAEALFGRLKRQVKADYNSKGQVDWRREAREDFDFEAGEQLNEDDKAILTDAKRPIVIFNRVGTTVDGVAGQEVGNRQEVQFLPRTPSAVADCISSEKSDVSISTRWRITLSLIRPTGADPRSAPPHALQRGVLAIWTRTRCIVQNRRQNSGGDDGDYRFPGSCLRGEQSEAALA